MPSNLVLKMIKIDDNLMPPTLGAFSLALFYNILNKGDTKYAEHIHEEVKEKPFSLSTIVKRDRTNEYYLNIKTLTSRNTEVLLRGITKIGNEIKVGRNRFRLLEVSNIGGISKNARRVSYEEMIKKVMDSDEITLHFLTPTAFRRKINEKIMMDATPDPKRIFRSLFKRWQAFSTIPFDQDESSFEELLSSIIILKMEDVKTHSMNFGKYFQNGFTGKIKFGIEADDIKRELCILADFAFFSGVGAKVTYGMGEVKRLL